MNRKTAYFFTLIPFILVSPFFFAGIILFLFQGTFTGWTILRLLTIVTGMTLLLSIPITALLWYDHRAPEPGLCVRCGYDLRGNLRGAACPECGEPMKKA